MPVITDPKPFDEVHFSLLKHGELSIIVIGCEDGARGCYTGGVKAVRKITEQIKFSKLMLNKSDGTPETIKNGLCDQRSLERLSKLVHYSEESQVLLLCCGAGLKNFKDQFPAIRIVPGLNTIGVGYGGQLACLSCGNCLFDESGCHNRYVKSSQIKKLSDCYEKKEANKCC